MSARALPTSELDTLQNLLKNRLPYAFKVYGELRSHLRGHWPGLTFVVDQWPEFKALVIKPDPSKVKTPYVANSYSAFASDKEAFKDLLLQPDVVDWSAPVLFSAIEESLWPTLEEVTKLKGGSLKLAGPGTGFVYAVTEETLVHQPMPEGMTLVPMAEDQADYIQERWKHSQEGSHSFIQALLQSFPSLALKDSQQQTVGYVSSYQYGAVGFLYVEPEHRGKGFGKLLLSLMAKALLDQNMLSVSIIEHDNAVSQKMHEGLGFSRIRDLNITWLRYTPSGCCPSGEVLCCV